MSDPTIQATIEKVLARHGGRPGPLLEVLHGVQDALGYVPGEAVPMIANGLNLSIADVHGVVTFYHHFRDRPAGRHVVQICRAEACQSMQGAALAEHARRQLAIEFNETTRDQRISLQPIYCFGNCACAPAVMIDGELHGRVTPERFDALIAALEPGK
ncbi:MAG: formate dehydrogenase subunit gamma [Acidobacteria bacterium RIFCSPLOWO2_02_FULL_64_15]|nr:MAG: formate dehydrogenase subunit gamma [Acidobacteria bacterium RIFCSPLOWO2_02_FULL_64_15]